MKPVGELLVFFGGNSKLLREMNVGVGFLLRADAFHNGSAPKNKKITLKTKNSLVVFVVAMFLRGGEECSCVIKRPFLRLVESVILRAKLSGQRFDFFWQRAEFLVGQLVLAIKQSENFAILQVVRPYQSRASRYRKTQKRTK